jgi:hypothetical protein
MNSLAEKLLIMAPSNRSNMISRFLRICARGMFPTCHCCGAGYVHGPIIICIVSAISDGETKCRRRRRKGSQKNWWQSRRGGNVIAVRAWTRPLEEYYMLCVLLRCNYRYGYGLDADVCSFLWCQGSFVLTKRLRIMLRSSRARSVATKITTYRHRSKHLAFGRTLGPIAPSLWTCRCCSGKIAALNP